jgi:hypothetical protein
VSIFIRLLNVDNKAAGLFEATHGKNEHIYCLEPDKFRAISGSPFAYWVSDDVRRSFTSMEVFSSSEHPIKQGIATADDFRFVRTWWEVTGGLSQWVTFAKGGGFSRYYASQNLVVNWRLEGKEIKNFLDPKTGKLRSRPQNIEFCFRRGLTWSDRTTKSLSARIWPEGGVFSVKGSCGFFPGREFFAAAIMNSQAFNYLIGLLVGAGDAAARSYQVGTIGKVPYPEFDARLEDLAKRAWLHKRSLDTPTETSHVFHLPTVLLARLGDYDPASIETELADIQAEIDRIAFDLYDFSEADRAAALASSGPTGETFSDDVNATEDADDEDSADVDLLDKTDGLLSWSVGVAFGRFDWRLATGERDAPHEPDPFDPLPAKSPGMLPDGAKPFHAHDGILVDDQGDKHDLSRLIEEVLARVEAEAPGDVRRWLQRDFFLLHLKQYSRSRRKAPIYWPLSTASGSYTLWLYYPNLTSQTLYTAINDFIEPKLEQLSQEVISLQNKGSARSRDDEKQFESLQSLKTELTELRGMLLEIAPTYRPNHDDGVQITAAPLWRLFRHKPWQKILNDIWSKLEKGDYDWAHLAMAYWPERVRKKCRTDKSLAIAHDLEHLYEEKAESAGAARGRKKAGASG